jgi:hypothetical protein
MPNDIVSVIKIEFYQVIKLFDLFEKVAAILVKFSDEKYMFASFFIVALSPTKWLVCR